MLDFITIPTDLLLSVVGKSKHLHVIMMLSARRNTSTNRTHFLSKPEIADATGISRRHIYNILESLEAMKIIQPVAERRGEWMWYLPFLEKTEKSEETLEIELQQLVKAYEEI